MNTSASKYPAVQCQRHEKKHSRRDPNRRAQKNMIKERCEFFTRFNDWELQLSEKPNSIICLAAVFELYDLLPDQAKQRPVNVEGIIKMREGLACLA